MSKRPSKMIEKHEAEARKQRELSKRNKKEWKKHERAQKVNKLRFWK
jgi:hypothetical protein